MTDTIPIYFRIPRKQVERIDALVASSQFPTKRAAVAAMLLGVGLDAAEKGPPVALTDGDRLRIAREGADMTQDDLATLLGYEHRSIVSQMERGTAKLNAKAAAWLVQQEEPTT